MNKEKRKPVLYVSETDPKIEGVTALIVKPSREIWYYSRFKQLVIHNFLNLVEQESRKIVRSVFMRIESDKETETSIYEYESDIKDDLDCRRPLKRLYIGEL